VIEPTDEMIAAFWAGHDDPEDGGTERGLVAVLAIVARDHVILPRGAQALCCREHPDVAVRWATCLVCVADMPPEERT
jgi:hypothetical protein